jgi:hypothetical protein
MSARLWTALIQRRPIAAVPAFVGELLAWSDAGVARSRATPCSSWWPSWGCGRRLPGACSVVDGLCRGGDRLEPRDQLVERRKSRRNVRRYLRWSSLSHTATARSRPHPLVGVAACARSVAQTCSPDPAGLRSRPRQRHPRSRSSPCPVPNVLGRLFVQRGLQHVLGEQLQQAIRATASAPASTHSCVDSQGPMSSLSVPISPDLSPACRARNIDLGTVPSGGFPVRQLFRVPGLGAGSGRFKWVGARPIWCR